MTPKSTAILHDVASRLLVSGWSYPETIELKSSDLFNLVENTLEVWYSPSEFTRDDAENVGFIRIPSILRLDESKCKKFKTSEISTKITHMFAKDYKMVLNLPAVHPDIEKQLVACLIYK